LGGASVSGTVTLENNRANMSMLVGTDSYGASITGAAVSGSVTDNNGENIGTGQNNFRDFWETTLDFGSQGVWDFSNIAVRGHPILRGLSGQ
jgi:hypothetical protein